MGGVSLGDLDEFGGFDGYSCPWCPTTVLVATSQDAAREVMEAHLDGHFSQAVPVTGPGAAPRLRPALLPVAGLVAALLLLAGPGAHAGDEAEAGGMGTTYEQSFTGPAVEPVPHVEVITQGPAQPMPSELVGAVEHGTVTYRGHLRRAVRQDGHVYLVRSMRPLGPRASATFNLARRYLLAGEATPFGQAADAVTVRLADADA